MRELNSLTLNEKTYDRFVGNLPQPATAKVGQVLVVAAVDGDGNVTEVEAVDQPSGGGGDPAPLCAVSIAAPSGAEYYYNTELLPEIPAEIIEGHRHVLIAKTPTTTRIYSDTNKPYYSTAESGHGRVIIPEGAYLRATLNADANAWVKDYSAKSSWLGVDGAEEDFAIWWSNYDVPKGSQDATEIYFPACEPKTEQPAAATRFYFNGVSLPPIPEDVLAQYPYAWIREDTTTNNYDLALSKAVWYLDPSGSPVRNASGVSSKWYRLPFADADAATEWIFVSDETGATFSVTNGRCVVWTSHNIPNGSASATTIYHRGTVAVPVPIE